MMIMKESECAKEILSNEKNSLMDFNLIFHIFRYSLIIYNDNQSNFKEN